MITALFLAVALICFVAAVWQALRTRARPVRSPLTIIMAAVGCAFLTLAPDVQLLESQLWPSLGRLLSNVATLCAAAGMALLVAALATRPGRPPRPAWPRLVPLLVAVAVLAVSFFLSHGPQGLGLFTGLYRSQPGLVVYSLTYSLYLGLVFLDISWACLSVVTRARGALRVGLVLMVLGLFVGLLYLAYKVFSVAREVFTGEAAEGFCTGPFAGVGCTASVGFPAIAALLLVLGIAIPALGPRIAGALTGLRQWLAYRQLHPLWQAMVNRMPEIVLDTPREEAGLRFRLYRRVIEIRDGYLNLAADLAGQDRPAGDPVAEAVAVLRALREYQPRGDRPAGHGRTAEAGLPEAADLRAETAWLCRVSRALRRAELSAA
ncbi:hypothetical protein GCM10010174_23380 [Kutzneria viridogrisea]|uniref:DUF6545 domain-containing protein n=1 Tax=Kutzneria viridogrisea TaxID=47990 RepID=A0ABR6BWF3_9PSEU|nr:hypothetical protein [Kutzneria viridogrisea]